MRPFTLFVSSIILADIFISAVAFITKENEIPANHLEVVLRNIGHRLLLSAKDSVSRILPVKKVDENTYQISFQKNFSFISDTLINIVEREFQENAPANNYIVNLKNCTQMATVLAFEINDKGGNLIPCRGRKLMEDCYFIEIDFLKANKFNYYSLLALIVPLSFAGFYLKDKFRKKEGAAPISDNNEYITLGQFKFYTNNHTITIDSKSISLSEKETKALQIFAKNTNQVVEREKLMKEIWEDEGIVVISRNVDVLVSKLRKKLSGDSTIKFINVHGRGYKFVIEQLPDNNRAGKV